MTNKVLIKSLFLIIIAIFFVYQNIATADEVTQDTLIAANGTKFSVKLQKKFATLKEGDFVKLKVNPRTLKNKKINWNVVNVTPQSNVFLVGYVSSIKKQETQLSNGSVSTSYRAQVDIYGAVINNEIYAIQAKLNSFAEDDVLENDITYNYDAILKTDLKLSDKRTVFVDKPDGYNRVEEAKRIEAEKKSKEKAAKEKAEEERLKKMAYTYTGPYTTFYYDSVNACRSALAVGVPANAYFICILDNMKKNQYTYSYGFKNGKLPYIANYIYLSLYKPYLNYGESALIPFFYKGFMAWVAFPGTHNTKSVNKFLYGK